jgi:hypothetical protein
MGINTSFSTRTTIPTGELSPLIQDTKLREHFPLFLIIASPKLQKVYLLDISSGGDLAYEATSSDRSFSSSLPLLGLPSISSFARLVKQ